MERNNDVKKNYLPRYNNPLEYLKVKQMKQNVVINTQKKELKFEEELDR